MIITIHVKNVVFIIEYIFNYLIVMLLTSLFHNENKILAHALKFLHTSVEDAICVFSAGILNTIRVLESILQNTIQSYFGF